MDMLPRETAEKMQSFWKKPEGKAGAVVAALLGAAALTGLYKALPFIITLLENTLYTVGLLTALGAVLYVLFDPKFRTLVGYLYRSVMRTITGWVIELDPINILKTYVEYLKESLEKMDQQIANLRGQIRKLQDEIKRNKQRMQDAVQLASEARKRDNKAVLVLQSRQAGRLQKSNVTYQDLLSKMEVLYRVLQKMREVADILVQDISGEVELKIKEREVILASHSAFKSAMNIINGDRDKKAMFDQTMEYLTADYGMKIGEIEHFIEMSSSFMDSVDLQNGVFEAEAMKMIEEWEKKGDSLLLGSEKQALISEAYDPENELSLDVQTPKRGGARSAEQGLDRGGGKYTGDLK
jgi:hypothetical protein